MIIEITSLDEPGVQLFSTLTEAQLRNRLEPLKGIFIAESPKVIQVALDEGYQPVALLCERRHIDGDAKHIIDQCGDIPVYTANENCSPASRAISSREACSAPSVALRPSPWPKRAPEPAASWSSMAW